MHNENRGQPMAAQPRPPENLSEILERHYARLVMAMETRNEGITYVMRVMQRDIETIRGQTADIETMREQITDIAAFQRTMMDTFNGFATDVMKIILALQQQANTTQQSIEQIVRHMEAQDRHMEAQDRHMEAQDRRMDAQDRRMDAQDQRLDTLEQTMRDGFASVRLEMEAIRQEMRDGFAAQAERHNELMLRVDRLERREPPRQERE
jgi:hypothetical protein